MPVMPNTCEPPHASEPEAPEESSAPEDSAASEMTPSSDSAGESGDSPQHLASDSASIGAPEGHEGARKRQGARKRHPEVIRRVLLAVAGLVLGLGVYTANAQLVGHDRMPMPFGVGVAVVLSGSMEPALHVDDVVVVTRSEHFDVGDVVVYQSGGGLVVHRVVSVGDGEVVTRGDANGADDAPVPLASVKGVVAFSVPGVGLLVRALQSPIGIIVVLVLVVVLVERSYAEGRRAEEQQLAELAAEVRRLRAGE